MKISVIMAVFNEEEFLPKSLDALMNQTLKPTQIIVVDDGSTDKSPQIIAKYPVTTVKLPVEKEASLERYPHVLSVGSRYLAEDFDYIAILDADTVIEPRYYEKLVDQMKKDRTIGIAGGALHGQPTPAALGLMPYVYGANRLYSRRCWLKINNGKTMTPIPQVDFYHNTYAEMLGFKTKRFDDLKSWALRPSGLGNAFLKGYHAYELGYYWYYLALRAARNKAPRMIPGYLKARFSGRPEYPIKPYVRRLQIYRLRRLITNKLV
jgi:glycosyltransferase involved in cell wall biosynthesis